MNTRLDRIIASMAAYDMERIFDATPASGLTYDELRAKLFQHFEAIALKADLLAQKHPPGSLEDWIFKTYASSMRAGRQHALYTPDGSQLAYDYLGKPTPGNPPPELSEQTVSASTPWYKKIFGDEQQNVH